MERNTTVMHGGDTDAVRWAIQPKEMKFDAFMNDTGGKPAEVSARATEIQRRGFRPAPRLHALTPGKAVKLSDTAALEDGLQRTAKKRTEQRAARLTLVYPHMMLEERPTSARNRSREPRPPQEATAAAAANNGGGSALVSEARKGVGAKAVTTAAWARPALRARPLAPLSSRSPLDLHVEGNSVLATDVAFASQALTHLTECVATERGLREQLEAARYAKLQAFRAVNKIVMGMNSDGGGTAEPHAGGTLRAFPETLALARCSVVTNTLVCTIQSYLRSYHARQLTFALQRLRRRLGRRTWADCCGSTIDAKSEADGDGNSAADAVSSRSGTTSRALEDLLDMQEISRLRQLYFDYYDCEVVSLDSPEWSASCDLVSARTLFSSSSGRESAHTASDRTVAMSNVASTTM